jgi:hypothetical protein
MVEVCGNWLCSFVFRKFQAGGFEWAAEREKLYQQYIAHNLVANWVAPSLIRSHGAYPLYQSIHPCIHHTSDTYDDQPTWKNDGS